MAQPKPKNKYEASELFSKALSLQSRDSGPWGRLMGPLHPEYDQPVRQDNPDPYAEKELYGRAKSTWARMKGMPPGKETMDAVTKDPEFRKAYVQSMPYFANSKASMKNPDDALRYLGFDVQNEVPKNNRTSPRQVAEVLAKYAGDQPGQSQKALSAPTPTPTPTPTPLPTPLMPKKQAEMHESEPMLDREDIVLEWDGTFSHLQDPYPEEGRSLSEQQIKGLMGVFYDDYSAGFLTVEEYESGIRIFQKKLEDMAVSREMSGQIEAMNIGPVRLERIE